MRYSFLLLSFFLTATTCIAQSIQSKAENIGLKPYEQEVENFEWKAHWIWLAKTEQSDVMLARRSFDIDEVPSEALMRISASSQYQLYINGEYVRRGPARSAPHHQSYDILDIHPSLRSGKNTIAILVHRQNGKYSYHHDGRAGLLAQLNMKIGNNETSLISDNQWKVSPDPAWSNEAPVISRFQMVVGDKVDMQKKITGWELIDFDDSTWKNATALMRSVGWPFPQKNANPQALTPPWTSLLPRDIPYLLEETESVSSLIQATQLQENISDKPVKLTMEIPPLFSKALKNFQKSTGPLQIPPLANHKSWLLLFDLGHVVNGMAQLDIQGPAGTKIEVLSAAFVVDDQFTHKLVDSDFKDEIILSGERDKWEATYFKPTRFLGIVVYGETEMVHIHSIGIRGLKYPFEEKGFMQSADYPWIAQYMEASAKTIEVCTTDGYTDNYRERRQYAQTGYYAALGNYYLFGDHHLQRRYLIQVAQEQRANGIMPAYAPLAKDDFMIIMDSNCLWLRSLRNYFLFSGDEKTVRELLPAARKLIELLHSYTNSLGMIYNPPYPYWLDHAQNDRRGANLCLNGHYLGALEDFSKVLEWLGEKDATIFVDRANLLRQSLQNHLWDEEKRLFADAWINGSLSNQFSEHANAIALALNIATEDQAKSVAEKLLADDDHNYIKRTSDMTMVTPAMSYFLHKGLAEYGYVDESLAMFHKRFGKMLSPNTNGTLWEEWWLNGTGRSGKFQGGRTRSDAQTESAFPPALFAEYLLGFEPIQPGMETIRLSRPQSKVSNIEAQIPTPEGLISVNWDLKKNGKRELALTIPRNVEVNLELESLGLLDNEKIFWNNREIKVNTEIESVLKLKSGKHRIQF